MNFLFVVFPPRAGFGFVTAGGYAAGRRRLVGRIPEMGSRSEGSTFDVGSSRRRTRFRRTSTLSATTCIGVGPIVWTASGRARCRLPWRRLSWLPDAVAAELMRCDGLESGGLKSAG